MKNNFFIFISSMKFAISVLFIFMCMMIYGTIIESMHGTLYAKRAVYHSPFFYAIYVALIFSLFFSFIKRLPFKKTLMGFYTVHISLITILIGAIITGLYGLDAHMDLPPQQSVAEVTLDQVALNIRDENTNYAYDLPTSKNEQKLNWQLKLDSNHPLEVIKYVPFAKEIQNWISKVGTWTTVWQLSDGQSFKKINLSVEKEGIDSFNWGPATMTIIPMSSLDEISKKPSSQFANQIFISRDEENESLQVLLPEKGKWNKLLYKSGSINLPWSGVKIELVDEFFDMSPIQNYESTPPRGSNDTNNLEALLVRFNANNRPLEVWVTNQNETKININDKDFFVSLRPKTIPLPFSITLDNFRVKYIEGTIMPESYESFVRINGAPELFQVYMNHPLKMFGHTFYQSSYYQNSSGEFHSVFSVNRDPGRFIKYLGALFLTLGLVLYFFLIYREKKTAKGSL